MDLALFLHILICLLAVLAGWYGVVQNDENGSGSMKINAGYVISFSLLLLFMGTRVSLGRDWDNYLVIFNTPDLNAFSFGDSFELGFLWLTVTLQSIDADFQQLVFWLAALTLFLFYRSYKKCYKLLPLAIFIFFVGWGYTVSINTMRQGVALFAFMCAISYIGDDDKYAVWKYLAFMLVGLLFHYTILLFLPCYFVYKIKLNLWQLVALCLSIFVVSSFVLMPIFNGLLTLFSKYSDSYSIESYYSDSITFGLGALLMLTVRLLPLAVYEDVIEKYPSFTKYFVLYYIGLGVYYGFFRFLLITRITFYFQFCELFVMPLFLYLIFTEKSKWWYLGGLFVLLVIINYFYTFGDFMDEQLVSPVYSLLFIDLLHFG